MSNREKLKQLIIDVFLLNPDEFRFDLKQEEIETWDSLGVVSLAVGIRETFGYHLAAEEAVSIGGVADIMKILKKKGIAFNG